MLHKYEPRVRKGQVPTYHGSLSESVKQFTLSL
jgi:hypothetical protein